MESEPLARALSRSKANWSKLTKWSELTNRSKLTKWSNWAAARFCRVCRVPASRERDRQALGRSNSGQSSGQSSGQKVVKILFDLCLCLCRLRASGIARHSAPGDRSGRSNSGQSTRFKQWSKSGQTVVKLSAPGDRSGPRSRAVSLSAGPAHGPRWQGPCLTPSDPI